MKSPRSGRSPLELVAGKNYSRQIANAEARKDASLAYKITRICLVPYTRPGLHYMENL
jgi:hypothetical protein